MKPFRLPRIVPMFRNLSLLFISIIVIFFSVYTAQNGGQDIPNIPVLSSDYSLEREVPVLTEVKPTVSSINFGNLLAFMFNLLSGVDLNEPASIIKAQIPMFNVVPVTADNFDEDNFDSIEEPTEKSLSLDEKSQGFTETVQNSVSSKKPFIFIYNTHTSETFELTDGVDHMKGKAGGVSEVAKEMQKVFSGKYGISTLYSDTIHDSAFNKSYEQSEKTVSKALKENPNLKFIFDVHRDGLVPRDRSYLEIKGQKYAKILLVVGTNARAPHPKWQENLKLARRLADKINSMYPGLCRGIAIKQGRYNQQLSTGAILVEIGSASNSTSEAVQSGRLFANAVVALLNDMEKKTGEKPKLPGNTPSPKANSTLEQNTKLNTTPNPKS